MNVEDIREFCLSLKGVTEEFPFGDDTLVFKVAGKIFCLANLDGALTINLKNDPGKNIELRETYDSIKPGYYMNKIHWNTVNIEGSLPDILIKNLIEDSYILVIEKLTRREKQILEKPAN